MDKIEYLKQKGIEFSNKLIANATKWELEFKSKLENLGIKFYFQQPIICSNKYLYIMDFYLPQFKLCIELDGKNHFTPSGIRKDKLRTHRLKKEKIQVIRIANADVNSIDDEYIIKILSNLNKHKSK